MKINRVIIGLFAVAALTAASSCSDEDAKNANTPQSELNAGLYDNKESIVFGNGFDDSRVLEIFYLMGSNLGTDVISNGGGDINKYEINGDGRYMYDFCKGVSLWVSADGASISLRQLNPQREEMFFHSCTVKSVDIDPSDFDLTLMPDKRLYSNVFDTGEKSVFTIDDLDGSICGGFSKPSDSEYVFEIPANKTNKARVLEWRLDYKNPRLVNLHPQEFSTQAQKHCFVQLPDGY